MVLKERFSFETVDGKVQFKFYNPIYIPVLAVEIVPVSMLNYGSYHNPSALVLSPRLC